MKCRTQYMDGVPEFPVWKIDFATPIDSSKEFVTKFIQSRKDDSWLLLTYQAVASDRHLWAAWIALMRRMSNQTMRSKGQDGEFLRLLAGTHHISQGFRRAGLLDGDEGCWIVQLPKNTDSNELPKINYDTSFDSAKEIAALLDCEITSERPVPQREGLLRLGIFDNENDVYCELDDNQIEEFMIAHIHTSDING